MSRSGKGIISSKTIAEMRMWRAQGYTLMEIAKAYGVSDSAVSRHTTNPEAGKIPIQNPNAGAICKPETFTELKEPPRQYFQPSTFINAPSKARLMAGR